MNRDSYIDFLRSLGLILVILAHVSAPNVLTQLRNFDVPLMVFVSGLSYSGKNISGGAWFLKRIARLIVPVYIFLTLFFLFNYLVGRGYQIEKIIYSYLLCVQGSIGYIWIIKVFLIMMLCTPFLIKIKENLGKFQIWLIIGLLLLLQELSSIFLSKCSMLVSETVPYIFGYSALFLSGMVLKTADNTTKVSVLVISLLLFVLTHYFLYYHYLVLDLSPYYKYPPRINYLLYGLTICSLLWIIRPIGNKLSSFIIFSFWGQNTIWIYLWHIPWVMLMLNVSSNWGIRYLMVLGGATFVYLIQYLIVSKLQKAHPSWMFLKHFKG